MRRIMAFNAPTGLAVACELARCFSYSINSDKLRRVTVTPSLLTLAALVISSSSCSAGVVMLA